MVVAIDIDKELKAEEALAHEEHNLRAIINNTDDVIWSVDKDFNIISANNAFWRYVSLLTGKTARELEASDFNGELFSAWNKLFDRGMKGDAFKTVWTNTFDGVDQVSEISFNPIRDEQGNVIGLSCFSRDITELRNQLKKIRLQNEQLKEVAWIQSHKVRNHVATILGLTQLVTSEAAGDGPTRFILDGIRKSSEELDSVIHEITEKTKEME
jgi:PAS domain S-box-containing protein